jgi:type I restriction enzyme S subunit
MKQMETVISDVGMSWEMLKLDDLCRMNSGGTPSRSNLSFYNGEIPWAKISDIENAEGGVIQYTEEHITAEGLASINNRIFEKGTLLLAMYGSVGKVAFAGMEMTTNQAILGIKIKDESKISYAYLKYWFQTIKEQLLNRAVGGTLQNISLGIVKDLQIPLPPLPIQKRIAEILDAADALKRKDQELLKKYDELAQAIFIDMFGDPVKNEKGWEAKKFQELGTLDRGVSKHRPRNASELLGGKYPLIQTGDVANSGGIITKYRSTYSEIGLKQSKMWSKGTLCITIAANIAKTGILDFDACFPDSIVGFKPNDKVSNSVFVQFWIGFLQKILEDNAPESAQKNINLEILRGLDVICPPVELQNKFEKIIEQLNLVKSSNSNFVADNLFQTLIQKAFKGELVAE